MMSKEFQKALIGIAAALFVWALQSWISFCVAQGTRITILETEVSQLRQEARYFHGNWKPEHEADAK